VRVTEPLDARTVTPGLRQRLPEGDPGVLDGVVLVDLQVAVGVDGEVQATVAAELVEHVIEERDTGRRRRTLPLPSRSTSTFRWRSPWCRGRHVPIRELIGRALGGLGRWSRVVG
jgi:hypothetical protein